MDKRTPSLLARVLPKIAGGTVVSIILDKILGGEDTFKTKAEFGALTPIKGLNGAEVVADQVSNQLQSLGFKVNNYPQIATDAKKAIEAGKSLEEAVEGAFIKARDRSDIIRDDDLDKQFPKDGVSKEHPEIPGPDLEIDDPDKPNKKTNEDDDPENASPENKKFINDLMQPGDAVEDIMLKRPQDLTEGEFTELKKRMIALPAGAEQDRLDKVTTAFLENRFGDGPAEHDAVGRMIDPQPVRTAPKTPDALRTVDGKPLEAGLKRIGQAILKDAKVEGLGGAIKNLQGGINFMRDAGQKTPMPFPTLKQDGVFGAKTRNGLRQTLVTLGQPKVREGIALSRFNDFARQGKRKGFDSLADATKNSMAPLFRDPGRPAIRPAEKIEAVTLQETLNNLGQKQIGGDFKPLKLDGNIGPKTENAFGQLTAAVGPERVTNRFGEFLGFF